MSDCEHGYANADERATCACDPCEIERLRAALRQIETCLDVNVSQVVAFRALRGEMDWSTALDGTP